MKKINLTVMFMFTFIFGLCATVFAQVTSGTVMLPVIDVGTGQDYLLFLVQSIGGAKGASTLAIVGIAIKIFLATLNQPFAEVFFGKKFKDWSGGLKLTVVLLLSYAAGIVTLMLPPNSLSFGAAFVHSSTLSAFLVLTNQIWKQYVEKKK